MSTIKGFFSIFHEFDEEGSCHQELPIMFKVKGVLAWEWHQIIVRKWHLLPKAQGMNDGRLHLISLISAQGNMWWQIKIKTRTMPTKRNVDSEHKLSWNITSYYGLNTQYFHVELFKVDDATFQNNGKKFIIMNFVVNLNWRKFTRWKPTECENVSLLC